VDLSVARCRWVNRNDDFAFGSFNLSRDMISINGQQTVSSNNYISGTYINYVKHYSRDKNFFSYNSIDDYALERFVDYCNYNGILYMDAFVCQSSNNNSTVCYNLTDTCDLRLWLNAGDMNYIYGWMDTGLDLEIQNCIKNFDMVERS
jgi:hypothetical protein